MSLAESYPDENFDQVVNDLLLLSLRFINVSDMLLYHEDTDEEEPVEELSEVALASFSFEALMGEVFRGLWAAKGMLPKIQQAGYANVDKVSEIAVLFKLFDLFSISPTAMMSTLCTNPQAFLDALQSIFSELDRKRPVTIEAELIASFRAHKINRAEAIKILNLRPTIVRNLWKSTAALAHKQMRKALEEHRAQCKVQLLQEGRKYTHLTDMERHIIMLGRCQGYSQSEIARQLGRNKGTISREVRRLEEDPKKISGMGANYDSVRAAEDYKKRRQACGRKTKHEMKNKEGNTLYSVIKRHVIFQNWSPEQIYHAALKNSDEPDFCVSVPTMYRWINSGLIYGLSRTDLRRKGKPYKKCYNYGNKYMKGTSITERPEHINDRSDFGHFEADSVVSGKDGSGRLFTMVERKTRFLFAKLVDEGTAENFVEFIKKIIKKYGKIIKSITVDNGPEFARWEELEDMGIKVYFARPYCSNDKGQIENHNGLIREYYPKGTDFSQISPKNLDMLCLRRINNRPRKVLDWSTPQHAFLYELNRLHSPEAV